MCSQLIKGGLSGAIILFIWGMVSWMVLPWHNMTMSGFKDEAAIEKIILEQAPSKGVYILPYWNCKADPAMSKEEKKALMEQNCVKMMKGPFAFAVINPQGTGMSMNASMIGSFVIQLIGALLVTALLSKANIQNYFCRVIFTTMFGLAAGVVCFLPGWNWWGFPVNYTLISILDLVVGWFLAGLVLAAIVKNNQATCN